MNDLLGWNDYKQTEHQEPLALLVHNREARLILDNQIQDIANRIQSKSPCPLNVNSNGLSNTQLQSCDKQMRSASNNRNSNSSFDVSPSRSLNNSPLSGIAENDMDSSDSETMKLTRIKELRKNGLSPDRDDQLSNSSRGSTPPSEVGAFWSTLSTPSTVAEAPEVVLCYWCKRVCEGRGALPESDFSRGNFPFTNGESQFCSEVCFNQCRRASFKKSKICDWCRLVKPTVSYVDFTDGDHQLQFCSDKCLNQYKMQIFCRETEAHLQLHPHLSSLAVGSHVGALITPELWLKDCNASSSSKKEADDDEGNKSTSQVSSDLRQSHPAGFGTESQLSISDSSSPLSFDDCEPVNLSTTQHQVDYVDLSRQGRKTSPVSRRTRSSKQSDDSNRLYSPRYGRPKTRGMKEFRETIADNRNLKRGKSPLENFDATLESKPKGTIRVRQLEEQPCPSKLDTPAISSSPSPTSSKAIVSGFNNFGGLLLGARQPLLQGLPSILPSVSHSDIPRPQILPQLLLSHTDFLRYQGLRPPFFLPQPPLQHLSQQPTPAIPPPLPPIPPPPQTTLQNPLGFPPITVLLPLPLPIPIPIPIPIPFPIAINSGKCSCGALLKKTAASGNDSSETFSASSLKQSIDKKNPDTSTISNPLTIKLKKQKLTDIDSQKTNIKSIPGNKDATELPAVQSDLSKLDKKERRSILKYTSDVYEINGVFVPREGGWNTLSKPMQPLPIKDRESEGGSTCPASPLSSTSNAQGIVDKEERCSLKKRPHNSENNEPVPKKKNLLT